MQKTIKAGQTLTARSIGNSDCVFTVNILARNKSFVTVKGDMIREPKRVKVKTDSEGNEFIMAHGTFSMAPSFRAIN